MALCNRLFNLPTRCLECQYILLRLQCYIGDVDRTAFYGLEGSPHLLVAIKSDGYRV